MTNSIRQTHLLQLLGLCLFMACNPSKVDIIKEPYTQVQTQITGMLTDIFNTAKAKDFTKLDAFHLNSDKFTKFDNDGTPQRQNYQENKIGEETAFKMLDSMNFKLHDVKVDVFDKVAISTFIISYSAKVQGTLLVDTARGTLTFVNYEDKWRITHEHFSKFKQN